MELTELERQLDEVDDVLEDRWGKPGWNDALVYFETLATIYAVDTDTLRQPRFARSAANLGIHRAK